MTLVTVDLTDQTLPTDEWVDCRVLIDDDGTLIVTLNGLILYEYSEGEWSSVYVEREET